MCYRPAIKMGATDREIVVIDIDLLSMHSASFPVMLKFSLFLGLVVFALYIIKPEAFPSEPAQDESSDNFFGAAKSLVTPARGQRAAKDAYVTLLYGGFLLGARVLGQSLKESGTKKELIAMCTETVSDTTKEVLRRDGWTIRPILNIHSPYEGLSKRGDYFSGIFSKLHVWNMTDYDRIVYLDSDVLVMSNIDHMFDCGTFCAAFRHSDLFNAGIIVVEPNESVFKDMMKKIATLPSYDDGDQGFLNVYFKSLVYAPFFNWSNISRFYQPMRLPAGLNSDIGSYYANSRWAIPELEIRNIHYTLGPIKPWIWWTNFLFDLNVLWTNVRRRLPQYSDCNHTYQPIYQPFFWAPYPILIMLYISMKFLDYSWTYSPRMSKALKTFALLNSKFSQFFPMPLLFLSYYLAYRLVVPTTMLPSQAEYVFWLWSNFFFLVLIGSYCYLCYIVGKRSDGYHNISRKKLWMLLLYVIFTVSYILLKVVPPAVKPFSKRVKSFFILLSLHVIVSQIAGLCLNRLWASSSKKGVDPEMNGSINSISLKTVRH